MEQYIDSKLDVDRICRVCLLENAELYLIFDEAYAADGAPPMSQILNECTRYRVERFDELPDKMCSSCMQAARNAFHFKRQTEKAYRTLLSLPAPAIFTAVKGEPIELSGPGNWANEKATQTDQSSIRSCEFCPAKFLDYAELQNHRLDEHRGGSKDCRLCGEKFERIRELRNHLARKHPDEGGQKKDFQCPVCNRLFSRKDHMRRHLQMIHKQQMSPKRLKSEDDSEAKQCPVCQLEFKRKQHMVRHLQKVHKQSLNSIKVSLEEPEIDMQESGKFNKQELVEATSSTFTNWPSFTDDDDDESEIEESALTATNPISSAEDDDLDTKSQLLSNSWLQPELNDLDIKVEPPQMEEFEYVTEVSPKKSVKNERIAGNEKYAGISTDVSWQDDYCQTDEDTHSKKLEPNPVKTVPPLVLKIKTKIEPQNDSVAKAVRHRKGDRSVFGITEDNRCTECLRTFSRHCHLRRHMLTHLAEKPLSCDQCSKRFARSDHLRNHIANVHNAKEYKCQPCNITFEKRDLLAKHNEAVHGDDPNALRIHECEYCAKKFTSKTYLRKHILLHTDRIYACKYCEETFKDRKVFREHEKTHTAELKKFLCSICGESFQRNDYLMVHMRRHNGEKPYKCQYCGKGFPRATDLKVHERYHTGHKPNLCTLCGKGFHRAYNLTIHMRTHTGEKPFQCDQCPKSFAQSNDLKAHIRRHTGERYKCRECDASFLQLYGLRQHALGVHGTHIESTTGRVQKFLHLADVGLTPEMAIQQLQQQQAAQQQPTPSQLQQPAPVLQLQQSSPMQPSPMQPSPIQPSSLQPPPPLQLTTLQSSPLHISYPVIPQSADLIHPPVFKPTINE